ncbi:MAG TPA: cobalamin-dependent protein [Longimicrobiales bacterium]|nr:cobalamin-dependent protein [Longimicrobiales bacterium]
MDFARSRGIPTVLSPFHPYEAHVWMALRDVREQGDFRRLHSLAMGWTTRGQIQRLAMLFDALGRLPSLPLEQFCDEGIHGFMFQVGEAWAKGRLRVGEEHLVSQAMTEVLLKLRADVREEAEGRGRRQDAPVAVVGTLEGNHHHLGSLCVRILLEQMGWEVYYLGADVPAEDFALIQRGRDATLACVSMPPTAAPGDVARAVRILGEFYDPSRPYALALGGSVPPDQAGELLRGPFREADVFRTCAAFRSAVQSGFGTSTPVGLT